MAALSTPTGEIPPMTMTRPMTATARPGRPSLGSQAASTFDIQAAFPRVTGLADDAIRLDGATAASVHASDFTINS